MAKRMLSKRFVSAGAVALTLVLTHGIKSEAPSERSSPASAALEVDNTTYIDANKILMFVTNHGSFGRDLADYFGRDFGTYYPYIDSLSIAEAITPSPLYAAGLWLGGVDSASGDTLVTVSEYSSEYVPGPMVGGTFQTDRPEFRVYKLYSDSLESNPNTDYLEWPVDLGAPVDEHGHPAMRGDQMLWAVYNDADPAQHTNSTGETEPIGIEVQQTFWASNEAGDLEIPVGGFIDVNSFDEGVVRLNVQVVQPGDLTGHDYLVVTDSTETELVWHLIDETTGDTLIFNRPVGSCDGDPVDGFSICAIFSTLRRPSSFEVTANGTGPLDPPESGAAPWEGFPVPTEIEPDGYPTDGQQVGEGKWLISTGSGGGTDSGGQDRGPFETWISRTFRGDEITGTGRIALFGEYDWEIRFTGSFDNPGVGGSYALAPSAFGQSDAAVWVPFELWRAGVNTPDDPSDDLKCFAYLFTDGGDSLFWMSSYGSALDPGNCGPGGCEHEISGGYDDPSTDWIYWSVPDDQTLPDAGYQAFESAILSGPGSWGFESADARVMDRLVFVNWNGDTTTDHQGGATIPSGYNQDMPEQGTVFRIANNHTPTPGQEFSFSTVPSDTIGAGPQQLSVYFKYLLINKGERHMKDVLVGLWLDPDLGGSGDDLIGCDTLTETMFCYNADNNDQYYGYFAPAIGFKLLEGPAVPSAGDTAVVDGLRVADYKNVGMYAFTNLCCGMSPNGYSSTYEAMWGLVPYSGEPYTYNGDTLTYQLSGDPVTGQGDLDVAPDDRRMMASYGPFDFHPGDTQQVVFKMAVGQGVDRLSSITVMRQILEYDSIPTGVEDDNIVLPDKFTVEQNYPNPFNPSTTIMYSLPIRSEVTIDILNVLGQTVATLDEGSRPAGDHRVVWNGIDDSGDAAATGVYFYRVKAGDNVSSKKMLLLK